MTSEQLLQLRNQAHENARKKGFHDVERDDKHHITLIISEVFEAINAERSGRRQLSQNELQFVFEHSDDKTFKIDFQLIAKDTIGDELADAFIRTLDYAGLCDVRPCLIEITRKPTTLIDLAYRMMKDSWVNCSEVVDTFLSLINDYCQYHSIPLLLHINLKMRYNKMREPLNGKKY